MNLISSPVEEVRDWISHKEYRAQQEQQPSDSRSTGKGKEAELNTSREGKLSALSLHRFSFHDRTGHSPTEKRRTMNLISSPMEEVRDWISTTNGEYKPQQQDRQQQDGRSRGREGDLNTSREGKPSHTSAAALHTVDRLRIPFESARWGMVITSGDSCIPTL